MTEYLFHGWAPPGERSSTPGIRLEAESPRHGAALALRTFLNLGRDITAPLAHVDVTDAGGTRHTLLVDEVVEWLRQPAQAAFVEREGLGMLLQEQRT